jgi:cytosine/adenosine deaminase-related metal-dependent hydrolase
MGAPSGVIIEPDWILTARGDDLVLLADHEVIIRADRVEEIRPRTSTKDARVSAPGQLLLPGLIAAHTHSGSGTANRGLAEGGIRPSGLSGKSRVSPTALRAMEIMDDLDDPEIDHLTTANVASVLRGGGTTQVEMSLGRRHAAAYVKAAGRLGVRGYVGPMVPSVSRCMPIWSRTDQTVLTDSVAETLSELEAAKQFAQTIDQTHDGRIRPMLAITVTAAHTRETLIAVRDAAKELSCPIHLHLQSGANTGSEHDLVRETFGIREVPLLAELGLLDTPLFATHLIGIDLENDLPLLAGRGVTFVHCPTAGGTGLSPGSQPYPEALAAGLRTAIGLDANSADMLENIKLAVIQGRAREMFLGATSSVPVRRPSIWDAMRSATLGAADGLGRADLGRIAVGAKADLCSVDIAGLFVGSGTPPPSPLNNLLYAGVRDIRNVMTDGVWQVRDGQLLFEDEARLNQQRGAVMRKLWRILEEEGIFAPDLASLRTPNA